MSEKISTYVMPDPIVARTVDGEYRLNIEANHATLAGHSFQHEVAYAVANGVQFGEPDAGLGNARTAALPGGGLVGVRAPMHESEEPVVRPYWLVDDIEAAVVGRNAQG